MRLTFINDHKFIQIDKDYYSTGKFSQETMSRYLIGPINEIQFLGRVQENKYDKDSLVQTTNGTIKVKPLEFLKAKKDFILKKNEIVKFLEKHINKKDIIIIRLPSHIGYVAADYLNSQKIPYGIELVGDPWDSLWHHGSFSGKVISFHVKNKVKKYIKNSKNNIYVTKNYLQSKYPSYHNHFSASNVFINKITNNYKNNNGIKKIGMVASLDTKYKGIDTALRSLSQLKDDFVFEIVGNGPQEKWQNKIEKLNLENKVKLMGPIQSGNNMDTWYSSLDLYIQPSYTEGLPRALIEAMSNGIPALGSDAGGIPELLNSNYIHKAKDYKTLRDQIQLTLENEDLRVQMSKENLLTSKNYLSDTIQKEREKFIKSIYKEHKNYES